MAHSSDMHSAPASDPLGSKAGLADAATEQAAVDLTRDLAVDAAVNIAGRVMDRSQLRAAGAAVARRIAGAPAVAVQASPTLETVVAVLGGILAGVPVVPLAPDAGPRERDHILADSGATALLVPVGQTLPGRDAIWDQWRGRDGRVLEVVPVDPEERSDWKALLPLAVGLGLATGAPQPTHTQPTHTQAGEMPAPAAGISQSEKPALILYTSGTTGPPKGVMVPTRAIAADLDALAEAWKWTPDDILVHGLPLFHVHGLVLGVLGPLRTGGKLIHTGRPTPAGYAAAISGGATMAFGVPTVWSRIAAEPSTARALASARLLVSGSAALPRSTFEALEAYSGQAPVERYGMTETLITIAVSASGDRRPGWVGRPVVGVDARLVDEDGSEIPADGQTPGQLEVRGPTLMSGYLGRPEETKAAMRGQGWFATGDAACLAPDGYYRILGRQSTDLIKCGGYRIGAGEVEDAMLAHPAVQEAAVVGEPDDDLGQAVVAYVVCDGVGPEALAQFVADTLSVHKRPRRIYVVDSLPRNAMGKIVKTALSDSARSR